ncbi:hypothetical protein NPIL_675841, partial [Nephila pilipes]
MERETGVRRSRWEGAAPTKEKGPVATSTVARCGSRE